MPKRRRQLKPRTRAGGEWTEARFWGFIRSALRDASRRYPPIARQALDAAAVDRVPNPKTSRKAKRFRCGACRELFFRSDVHVDHVVECGTLKSFDDVATFAERLFCEPESLVVLCKRCHLQKSQQSDAGDA